MQQQADFGLVGLAVMGENLVLNIESRGFTVAVFNRTVDKVDHFVQGRAQGKKNHRCTFDCRARRIAQETAQNHANGKSRQTRR